MTDVCIVGGGFCGAMTAAHLAAAGVTSVVVEPGILGRGTAYSAPPWLLLNTPSPAMSALPDAPNHFVDWLAARGEVPRFAPRATYGAYVTAALAEVARRPLVQTRARAVEVTRMQRGFAIGCDDGVTLHARHLVLALGNAAPRRPEGVPAELPGYVDDPYRALAELPCDDRPVVLLGSGLTALDVLVSLRARGHRGRVVLLSRRGLVPLPHGAYPGATTVPADLLAQPTLGALLAWWRANTAAGVSGPPQIDALRPHLPALWGRLPVPDRARFLRHVRSRWEVIRHRAPPQIRAVLDAGRAAGDVDVIAGRLAAASATANGLALALTGGRTLTAAWLVNCTGPERDLARLDSPLVRSLRARGLVTRDALGLGVRTDADGLASPGVHVVGGWRAADRWESTAVPELRGQAAATARAIATHAAAPARVMA